MRRQPGFGRPAAAVLTAIAYMCLAPQAALALAGPLASPKGIAHRMGYPADAQRRVVEALEHEGCKFVAGSFVNWVSSLHYVGETEALNGMMGALAACPGVTVTVAFLDLEKEDWVVVHDASESRVDVQINLSSKRIKLASLALPPINGPAAAIKRSEDQRSALLRRGARISLANRARQDKLVLDIDGETGQPMTLQPYTDIGGCDWIVHDVGEGYVALQNRYSGQFLDVRGEEFGRVILADYTPLHGCDWRMVKLDNGYHKLVNRYWSDKKGKEIVLDIDGQTGMPIVAPYTGWGGGCDWRIENR